MRQQTKTTANKSPNKSKNKKSVKPLVKTPGKSAKKSAKNQPASQKAVPKKLQSKATKPSAEPAARSQWGAVINIMRPAAEIYRFWRDAEKLPLFMGFLGEIQITQEQEGKSLSWKSAEGSKFKHQGSMTLEERPFDRGTFVHAVLDSAAPGGKITKLLSSFMQSSPEENLKEGLRKLRWLMEAGEIPTIEGQSSGRRKDDNSTSRTHH